MSKRKENTETEGSCAPAPEHWEEPCTAKRVCDFVEDESTSSKETFANHVEAVVCEEAKECLGEEEEELEMRDKWLEESSFNFKINNLNLFEKTHQIIKLKGKLPNLSLPSGWIALNHHSGGIIYLHRQTRVCTWARPYHIGDASVRKHDVPTAAIPCLHQFIALKKSVLEKANQDGQAKAGNTGAECGNVDLNDDHCDGNLDVKDDAIGPGGNGNLDNQASQLDTHDGNLANHDGYLDNHDGNLGDHTGNLGNNAGDLNNHDGNIDNHDGNDHDGNLGDHTSNLGNHAGDLNNHGGNIGNHDGDDHDGNVGDHTSNLGNHAGADLNNHDGDDNLENVGGGQDQDGVASRGIFQMSSEEIEMTTTTELSDYLKKLWDFQNITAEEEKQLLFRPCVDSEILETVPFFIQGSNPDSSKLKDKSAINPAGKSPQSFLHEYCCKILKLKPTYKTVESGDVKMPFLATVEIDGLQYGSGTAASKKQARHIAAQATMEVLIPGTFEKLMHADQHLEVFDNVLIDNPHVYELTSKLGLLSPNQMLNECVKRNQGVLSSQVKFEMHHTSDKKIYYSIECGKHKTTGPCRNKKIGRELAAQALLKKLHPHLKNWGSLLRIYLDKHTMQEFTKVEDKLTISPTTINRELLSDLKHEMWLLLKDKTSNPCTRFTSMKLTDIDI